MLFKISINEILWIFAKYLTLNNYADDNIQFYPYPFDQVINNLPTDFDILKVWFYDNFLVLNPKKCDFVTLGNGNNFCNFSCNDIIIKNSLSEKILGLTIDNNLGFSYHISNICKTTNEKLKALFTVSANSNAHTCSLLILLFNLTSINVRLFGCSIIEKSWTKSTKYKNVIHVQWQTTLSGNSWFN